MKRSVVLGILAAVLALLCACAGTAAPQSAPLAEPATPAAPTPTPEPTPTPLPEGWHAVDTARDDEVTLAFTGDVNFADDWYIMQNYRAGGGAFADNFSPDLLKLLNGADLLLCNNEFSISDRGAPMPGKQFTFRAGTANVAYWQVLGADVVSLANNHCGDYGQDAFLDTMDTLTAAGIPYIGAGRDLAEARQAQYFVANGITFAYIGATRAEKYILTPQATDDQPGVLYTYDPENTLAAIRAAREQADFVIVYVHWGTEESTVLESAQTELATLYREAGADLIVGAHPHILQGAGWREDTPVFYSLGNFWFNMQSQDTALLLVTVRSPEDFTCKLLPCRQESGRTSLATDAQECARVLDSLNDRMESGYFDEFGVLRQ